MESIEEEPAPAGYIFLGSLILKGQTKQLQGALTVPIRANWSIKTKRTVKDYNPLNTIGLCETTLIINR